MLLSLLFIPMLPSSISPAARCSPGQRRCVDDESAAFRRDELLDRTPASEVALMAPGSDGRPFELPDHRQAIRELTGVAGFCTDWLLSARWRQDLLHQGDNRAHFDNCAFADGTRYLRALVDEATTQAAAMTNAPTEVEHDRAAARALLALGRALHAIQDFYAHSNFVELHDEGDAANVELRDVPLPALWTKSGADRIVEQASKGELWSGRWFFGTYRCAGGNGAAHRDLAKDSAKTREGQLKPRRHPSWGADLYAAARFLALRSSRQFIDDAFPAPLRTLCGTSLGVLAISDHRRDASK